MWAKIMVGDFVNLGEFNANSVIQAELESLAASVSGSSSSATQVKAGRPVASLIEWQAQFNIYQAASILLHRGSTVGLHAYVATVTEFAGNRPWAIVEQCDARSRM